MSGICSATKKKRQKYVLQEVRRRSSNIPKRKKKKRSNDNDTGILANTRTCPSAKPQGSVMSFLNTYEGYYWCFLAYEMVGGKKKKQSIKENS